MLKVPISIRRLEDSDQQAFEEATRRWDNAVGFTWETPTPEETFEDFVQSLKNYEKGIGLPAGYVPYTVLYAFVESQIAARVSIRHTLNEFLLNYGGHIGYGVIPEFRRQGIGTRMLQAGLEVCRDLNLKRVLVTCDETNLGSEKVIQACGGKLENVFSFFSNQIPKCRYWIEL